MQPYAPCAFASTCASHTNVSKFLKRARESQTFFDNMSKTEAISWLDDPVQHLQAFVCVVLTPGITRSRLFQNANLASMSDAEPIELRVLDVWVDFM